MSVWEPSTGVDATSIQGVPVSSVAPTNGQELVLVGGSWTPTSEAGGGAIPLATVTAAGDLIVATGNAAVTNLADVATGQVLKSGGVGVAPAWGTSIDVPLSTVTAVGDLIVATGAGAVTALAAAIAGDVLTANGVG